MITHAKMTYFNLCISLVEVTGGEDKGVYLRDEDNFSGSIITKKATALDQGLEFYVEACQKVVDEIKKDRLDKQVRAAGMINAAAVDAPVLDTETSAVTTDVTYTDPNGKRKVSDLSRQDLEQALCKMIRNMDNIRCITG